MYLLACLQLGRPLCFENRTRFLCLLFAYANADTMQSCRISITTSYSTSVKIFYRGLTEVFLASPFCDSVHEGQVKRNHLS